MKSHEFDNLDALVVGGGPAGAACVIQIMRAGGHAALIEAGDFSRCRAGEVISPAGQQLLLQLGVDPAREPWSVSCSGVIAAWAEPSPANHLRVGAASSASLCIDRRGLDRALFAKAKDAGAIALAKCQLASANRRRGIWEFRLRTETGSVTGSSRWIVAACGRSANAPLAPSTARIWIDHLVGIAFIGPRHGRRNFGEPVSAIVEAAPNGWWYSVYLPDGRPVAIFFTDSDLLPKGKHERAVFLRREFEFAELTKYAFSCTSDFIADHRWVGFDARSGIRKVVVSDGWTAAGDALMAFDPLCGRGVSEAIHSGREVAGWLMSASGSDVVSGALPDWVHRASERFNTFKAERAAVYRSVSRWPSSAFWQRRSQV